MFADEHIQGYFCQRCKKEVLGVKEVKVSQLPHALIIHINRLAEFDSVTKVKNPVDFPLEGFNLADFIENKKNKLMADVEFKLTGVVVHFGTANRGHYVAYVRHEGTGGWVEINDLRVREVNASQMMDVAKENVYMLVYERE